VALDPTSLAQEIAARVVILPWRLRRARSVVSCAGGPPVLDFPRPVVVPRLALGIFLQRIELGLEPDLRYQRRNHCTRDHCGQKNSVLLLVDDMVGQPE